VPACRRNRLRRKDRHETAGLGWEGTYYKNPGQSADDLCNARATCDARRLAEFVLTRRILVWPPYGIGQAIIILPALWFLLSSIFFLAYSQPSQMGCLPYFHTWCGLSANLRCRSESAARGSLKIQDAKARQKSRSGHHRTFVGLYLRN